ncbi:right-handed parallel beta-helix repeat-containing protein [Sphingomonas sp. RB3P16]|uniref:right-handed parallel beta-helix repeat-containing protein n=1 Tax=Parasphingomonas frigoris TaxID=3096163 RepID=UPI002FC789F6
MFRIFGLTMIAGLTLTTGCYATPANPATDGVVSNGADPSGIADSSRAFNDALSKSPSIYVPCGTYRLNLKIVSKTNVSLRGAGSCTIFKPVNPKVPVLSIERTNFSEFRSFSVIGARDSGSSGIVITSSGNAIFSNILITGFSVAGFKCTGGTGSSGVKVTESYVLENGEAGIWYDDCQDFFIRENNIGKNKGIGLLLNKSSAGQIESNFIWENGVAISASAIFYDWFSRNRLTQSAREAFICDDCGYINISNNQSYQNSSSEKGKFEDWKFRYARNVIISENMLYDWTGTPHVSHGITVDQKSSKILLSNNIFENQSASPVRIEPGAKDISQR